MTSDERDSAGVVAPPPLIYAILLALGLLLTRQLPVPFLPRGTARILGWSLLGGGLSLAVWARDGCGSVMQSAFPAVPE